MQLAVFLVIVLPLAMSAPNKERALSLNPILQSMIPPRFAFVLNVGTSGESNVFCLQAETHKVNIFHADEIKLLVTDLIDDLGSDNRKGECNTECIHLVDAQVAKGTVNTIEKQACPLVCTSLQELAHFLHIPHPSPSSATTY